MLILIQITPIRHFNNESYIYKIHTINCKLKNTVISDIEKQNLEFVLQFFGFALVWYFPPKLPFLPLGMIVRLCYIVC